MFSKNRDRLLPSEVAQAFFAAVAAQAKRLMSDEHFTVDGTLIQAWASQKSFKKGPRQETGRVGMSRGGLGMAYLVPTLSVAGASLSIPCSVFTSRSSNRTCASRASGSRTEHHAFAHGRLCGSFGRQMSPIC